MTTKYPKETKLKARIQPTKDVGGIVEALAFKAPQANPDMIELRRLVEEHQRVTRKAVAIEAMTLDRVVRQGPRKGEKIPCNLPEIACIKLRDTAKCLKQDAEALEPSMREILRRQPIYQQFLRHTPGFAEGWILGSYLVGCIDIRHGGRDGKVTKAGVQREYRDPAATKLSHIVRYCGYAGGRDADGSQTGKLERRTAGVKLGYNAELRSRLYLWARVLIQGAASSKKIATSKYYRLIIDTKHRLQSDPRFDEVKNKWEGHEGGAKGYIHSKSWHKAVHLFLEDMYIVWRSLEGLPVWPSYYAAKLGYGHGGMPTASIYGAGLGPKLLTVSDALSLCGLSEIRPST